MDLVCPSCKGTFTMPAGVHRSKLKQGIVNLYCSMACRNIGLPKGKTSTLVCPSCKGTFTMLASRQRKKMKAGYVNLYCSRKCKDDGVKSAKKVTLVCPRCQKEFVRTESEQRKAKKSGYDKTYCSVLCKNQDINESKKTHVCPTCGTWFDQHRPSGLGVVYCKPECKPQRNRKLLPRLCPNCSQPFKPRYSVSVYCSSTCHRIAKKRTLTLIQSIKPLIAERDLGRCTMCMTQLSLVMHHIDEDRKNNTPENLITLCSPCHTTHHKSELTPFPQLGIMAIRRSMSMTSKWKRAIASLLTESSSTTA